jgi:hypothetical protein
MDRPRLRDVILRKLDDGTLPTQAPNKVYSGYGSGATCGACATRSSAYRSNTS